MHSFTLSLRLGTKLPWTPENGWHEADGQYRHLLTIANDLGTGTDHPKQLAALRSMPRGARAQSNFGVKGVQGAQTPSRDGLRTRGAQGGRQGGEEDDDGDGDDPPHEGGDDEDKKNEEDDEDDDEDDEKEDEEDDEKEEEDDEKEEEDDDDDENDDDEEEEAPAAKGGGDDDDENEGDGDDPLATIIHYGMQQACPSLLLHASLTSSLTRNGRFSCFHRA